MKYNSKCTCKFCRCNLYNNDLLNEAFATLQSNDDIYHMIVIPITRITVTNRRLTKYSIPHDELQDVESFAISNLYATIMKHSPEDLSTGFLLNTAKYSIINFARKFHRETYGSPTCRRVYHTSSIQSESDNDDFTTFIDTYFKPSNSLEDSIVSKINVQSMVDKLLESTDMHLLKQIVANIAFICDLFKNYPEDDLASDLLLNEVKDEFANLLERTGYVNTEKIDLLFQRISNTLSNSKLTIKKLKCMAYNRKKTKFSLAHLL